jgi:hypothetical protein
MKYYLTIGDIHWKISSNGAQYAEITVHGKTASRTLPLIVRAKLFVSFGRANFGQPLSRDGMLKHYQSYYRDIYFPNLLRDPKIPPEDKEKISGLLRKPWNLYIFRHSALTHKSQILKEATLRDHAGWSMNSKMPAIYIHYLGTESCNSLLESQGIIKIENSEKMCLMSVQCSCCGEPNKPSSSFCIKCKTVLKPDEFIETLEKENHKHKEEIKAMNERMDRMDRVLELIERNPILSSAKRTALERLADTR